MKLVNFAMQAEHMSGLIRDMERDVFRRKVALAYICLSLVTLALVFLTW